LHQEVPPFEVQDQAAFSADISTAGYISMVVLPQHVSTPAAVDKLTWAMLSMQNHLQASTTALQVKSNTNDGVLLM